ncbi:MAG: hypothetical protein PF692_12540 [Kiritimatiellae bacterium]|jgi:N-acetylglucosamine-6-phosphate deacetylase|nr:hypothetical protein [Kiritimatiellia bacterium]
MKKFRHGFVDLQVNGCCGIDFSDIGMTEEAFAKACRLILDSGTVAFLPTVIARRHPPLPVRTTADRQRTQRKKISNHQSSPSY